MSKYDPLAAMSFGDDDDADAVDLMVISDDKGNRRAFYLPMNIQRALDNRQLELIAEMQGYMRQIEKLQKRLDAKALEARRYGTSWATIGWSVGLTGEGARQRWMEGDEDV